MSLYGVREWEGGSDSSPILLQRVHVFCSNVMLVFLTFKNAIPQIFCAVH